MRGLECRNTNKIVKFFTFFFLKASLSNKGQIKVILFEFEFHFDFDYILILIVYPWLTFLRPKMNAQFQV